VVRAVSDPVDWALPATERYQVWGSAALTDEEHDAMAELGLL
jgi:hypothetical protein